MLIISFIELTESAVLAICKELEKVLVTCHNRKSQVFITDVVEAIVKGYPKWTVLYFAKVIGEFAAAQKKYVAT